MISVFTAYIIDDKYLVVARTDDGYQLLKLNRDGSLDNSFQTSTFTMNSIVAQITVQKDGKIIISGDMSVYNGENVGGIVRLNIDGSVDNSFNSGVEFIGQIRDISIQQDGKIVLEGNFDSFNETTTPGSIVRLNTDGGIDPNFVLGPVSNLVSSNFLYKLEILENGKIIIAGSTTDDEHYIVIARLNDDGSIDNTFPHALLTTYKFNMGFDLRIGPQHEIFVMSGIIDTNSDTKLGFIALNQSGEILDLNPNLRSDPIINAAVVQSDGKILVGGEFFDIGDKGVFGLARFNSDGGIDNGFNIDIDLSDPNNARISSLALQSDGKIVVGGYFSQVLLDMLMAN